MTELLKATVVAVALLAINAPLADWYRERVMWYGIGERTMRQFEEYRDEIDTLILGDSHPKWGLHPLEIGRAFNLALPGQQYAETYYVLRSLLDREGVDIQIIVMQADLHSFAVRGLDRFPLAHFYAPTVDYPEMGWRRGSPFVYSIHWLLGRYAPYVGERGNILSYFASGKPADLDWLHGVDLEAGALVRTGSIDTQSSEERVERANRRVRSHFGDGDPISPFLEHYFRKILDLCAAHQINVVLLQFPVTLDYLEAAGELVDVTTFDRRIRELIGPYENVELVDTRDLFVNRIRLFVDPDHLNKRGAIRYSRRIRDQVIARLRLPRKEPSSSSSPEI